GESMLRSLNLDDHRLDLGVEARRQLVERIRVYLLFLFPHLTRANHVEADIHHGVADHAVAETAVAVLAVDDRRDDRRNAEAGAPVRLLRQLVDLDGFLARVLAPAVVRA